VVDAPLTWRPTRNEAVTCPLIHPDSPADSEFIHLFPRLRIALAHNAASTAPGRARTQLHFQPYYGRPSPLHCDLWNTQTCEKNRDLDPGAKQGRSGNLLPSSRGAPEMASGGSFPPPFSGFVLSRAVASRSFLAMEEPQNLGVPASR
jgi:hypothetical protein